RAARVRVWATASTPWTPAAPTSRQRGVGRPPAKQDRNRRRWLPSNQVIGDGLASRLGALDSRCQTGIATTVADIGRAGGYLSSGRLASPPRERPRRGRVLVPHPGPLLLPIYLAWAA